MKSPFLALLLLAGRLPQIIAAEPISLDGLCSALEQRSSVVPVATITEEIRSAGVSFVADASARARLLSCAEKQRIGSGDVADVMELAASASLVPAALFPLPANRIVGMAKEGFSDALIASLIGVHGIDFRPSAEQDLLTKAAVSSAVSAAISSRAKAHVAETLSAFRTALGGEDRIAARQLLEVKVALFSSKDGLITGDLYIDHQDLALHLEAVSLPGWQVRALFNGGTVIEHSNWSGLNSSEDQTFSSYAASWSLVALSDLLQDSQLVNSLEWSGFQGTGERCVIADLKKIDDEVEVCFSAQSALPISIDGNDVLKLNFLNGWPLLYLTDEEEEAVYLEVSLITGEAIPTFRKRFEPDSSIRTGYRRQNSKDLQMYLWVESGTLTRQCFSGDDRCQELLKEEHQKKVKVKGFWLGQSEVTQEAFQRIMGYNPSKIKDAKLPVTGISPSEASLFCAAAFEKGGGTLPNQDQWMFAALAGRSEFGREELEWVAGRRVGKTLVVQSDGVASVKNAWGFINLVTNAGEWTNGHLFPFIYIMQTKDGDEKSDQVGFRCTGDLLPPPPSEVAEGLPDINELLKRHYNAVGGIGRLNSLDSVSLTGWWYRTDFTGSESRRFGYLWRRNGASEMIRCGKGSASQTGDPYQSTTMDTLLHPVDGLLVGYDRKRCRIESIKRVRVDDRSAITLRRTCTDSKEIWEVDLDEDLGVILQTKRVAPEPVLVMKYEEYAFGGGLFTPRRIVVSEPSYETYSFITSTPFPANGSLSNSFCSSK